MAEKDSWVGGTRVVATCVGKTCVWDAVVGWSRRGYLTREARVSNACSNQCAYD
jgi:hypothetical protein